MQKEKALEFIKRARENAKKRNFIQSIDLIINFRDLDLKKPENRIRDTIILPYPVEKEINICFILDSLLPKARELGKENIKVLSKDEMSNLTPKEIKKIANTYDIFYAEAPLMPLVARYFGKYLGPRGKMPFPVPPNTPDLKPFIEKAKKTVLVKVINTPVLQARIGVESMDDDKIAENLVYMMDKVNEICEKKGIKIKNAYLKLTMGKPVKVEVK